MKNMDRKNQAQNTRPPRIVAVCYRGADKEARAGAAQRLADMREIAALLPARPGWAQADAVLFPGGFLAADKEEAAALRAGRGNGTVPACAAQDFFAAAGGAAPQLQLVVGVDTPPFRAGAHRCGGQQLALAFNRAGLSGFAPKVFPVDEDFDGRAAPPLLVRARDFAEPRRFIPLANGGSALLNACYDMFGISAAARGLPEKALRAALVEDEDGRILARVAGREALRRGFAAYCARLAQERPGVALAAIHRFEKPGSDIFWQRHGIAAASAGLGGGLAIAAAHVRALSPDPAAMPLAAAQVGAGHLEAGGRRQSHALPPRDAVSGGGREKPRWIARLYAP
jgi:hypothetical protein